MLNIIRQFQSLSEYVTFAEQDLPSDNIASRRGSIYYTESFTGTPSKAKAFQLIRQGYPQGKKQMEDLLAKLNSRIVLPTMHDQFNMDVAGCAPNVEARILGLPEDMFFISSVEATAPPTTLNVQLELCYSAFIEPKTVTLAGAIIFAAMTALRMQGCAVSILATHTVKSHASQRTWQCAVPIPNNLDIDTLSFLLTHPSHLRRLVFSIMEHEPEEIRQEFSFGVNMQHYSMPFTNPNPDCQAHLKISEMCNTLHDANNITKAAEIFQNLVDSKFQSITNDKHVNDA